ncbi:DEAD/DEAH box helicase [Aquibacillus salsiterrae]|uniref:DEAD/DEAH box helicase family protein n=1 Tax=Aquibacillus salsiterrae TaxID=2950439 RepID=A0A9X3WCY8_9BACI|nr:DEAD/DEAH box helicase family protein [Aquibacillus salsiterrae]MDC3416121.1 DEAD/DEAH box helicase family protein [Aquibacillus salsiterrae]
MINSIIPSLRAYFSPSYDWIPKATSNLVANQPLSLRYGGKLLLREDIELDDTTFDTLCRQSYFQMIPALEQYLSGYRCKRCGNKTQHLFAKFACARCGNSHHYCRKCVEMGRVLACQPLYYWTGPPPVWEGCDDPLLWNGTLTKHQQLASSEIAHAMEKGRAELLTWAVCGAGKTEMLFYGIANVLRAGKRVCLATPRADVVRELLPRFRHVFPKTTIDGLYGGSEDKAGTGQLIIATTHQLIRYAQAFDVVIIDEIDAFPYHADPTLPFVTKRAAKPSAAMIYLTATPRHNQLQRIRTNRLPVVFVPVRFHGHPLPVPTFCSCSRLKQTLATSQAPQAFYQWYYNRKEKERQLLIFVPRVDLAERMVSSLSANLSVSAISAVHAADTDRADKVQQFRDRKLFVLVTTTILERGVTFPSVDVAVIDAGHSVFDQAALVQIAGRAGRSPDDPTGEVVFFHDGKSEAMVGAVKTIKAMNKKGEQA